MEQKTKLSKITLLFVCSSSLCLAHLALSRSESHPLPKPRTTSLGLLPCAVVLSLTGSLVLCHRQDLPQNTTVNDQQVLNVTKYKPLSGLQL